jgi:hypothetical protein
MHILQGAKIMKIELYVTVGGTGFDSNDYMVFEAKTQRLNKGSRTVTTQKTATFNYSSGGNWASGGNVTAVVFDAISGGDTAFIIDNDSYGYYLTQRITVSTAPGIHSQALEIFGGTVTYYIREASHAY